MKISRCGSQKFRGWVQLADVDAPHAQWDDQSQSAEVTTIPTGDRYYPGLRRPHWRAQLSIKEIRLLLDSLAAAAEGANGKTLAKELASSNKSLLRLLYAANGLAHKARSRGASTDA